MAKWQQPNRKALQPIPRVVDNTDAMAIKQLALVKAVRIKVPSDMPSGAGSFSPYGNTNFPHAVT